MEDSMFWATSGVGDGPAQGYTQAQTVELQRMLWTQDPTTQGVALNYLGELLVTNPEWQTLRVPSGGGVVYGFPYRNTEDLDFVLRTPTLGTTGWRLVLRADWTLRTVRAVLLENDDGSSGYPAVTQNAGYRWEISLAHGTITIGGAVTIVADDRAFLGSSAQIDHNDMANRTREFFVQAVECEIVGVHQVRILTAGWPLDPDSFTKCFGGFYVPNNYVSDMVVTAVTTSTVGGGNLMATNSIWYAANGELANTHVDMYGPAATPGAGAWVILMTCAVPMLNAAIGDFVNVRFDRDGADAADTAPIGLFIGWHVAYLADS